MQSIRVTIRVVTKNPKIQVTKVFSAETEIMVDKIVGVIDIPQAELQPGEPTTQLLTVCGPFDIYEPAQKVLKKIEKALNPLALV